MIYVWWDLYRCLYWKFLTECDGENFFKIGQFDHESENYWTSSSSLIFWLTVYLHHYFLCVCVYWKSDSNDCNFDRSHCCLYRSGQIERNWEKLYCGRQDCVWSFLVSLEHMTGKVNCFICYCVHRIAVIVLFSDNCILSYYSWCKENISKYLIFRLAFVICHFVSVLIVLYLSDS